MMYGVTSPSTHNLSPDTRETMGFLRFPLPLSPLGQTTDFYLTKKIVPCMGGIGFLFLEVQSGFDNIDSRLSTKMSWDSTAKR